MQSRAIGRVVTAADAEYDQARKGWNDCYQSRPREIVYCRNTQEVVAALAYARGQGVPFRIRSGGHSTEGYSSVDDGIVLNLSELNSIELSDDLERVVVGPGATNREISRALAPRGRVVPGGTCENVAIAGFTLGGGGGLLARTFGMMIDNVLALELVDSRGRILTVDAEHHPDLFWACRGGGGGNFGIVTSFTLRTHAVSEVVMFRIVWPWEQLQVTLDAWQRWALSTDVRVNAYYTIQPEQAGWVDIGGLFVGTPRELAPLLQELLDITPPPREQHLDSMPYLDATQVIFDKVGTPQFHKHSRATCLHEVIYEPLDDRGIGVLADWHATAPGRNTWSWLFPSRLGSETRTDHAASALWSGSVFSIDIRGDWTDPAADQQHFDWFRGIHHALQPYADGAYLNWTDRNIENRPHVFYRDNFPRLVEIKHRWDPDNVFTFPAGIPPSLTMADAERLQLPHSDIAALRASGRLTTPSQHTSATR